MATAQPQKLILHLQSLSQTFAFPVNDSIIITGGKANVSTNSQAYLTRFNIKNKTWNHLLECPDSLVSFMPLILFDNNNVDG